MSIQVLQVLSIALLIKNSLSSSGIALVESRLSITSWQAEQPKAADIESEVLPPILPVPESSGK